MARLRSITTSISWAPSLTANSISASRVFSGYCPLGNPVATIKQSKVSVPVSLAVVGGLIYQWSGFIKIIVHGNGMNGTAILLRFLAQLFQLLHRTYLFNHYLRNRGQATAVDQILWFDPALKDMRCNHEWAVLETLVLAIPYTHFNLVLIALNALTI